MDRRNFLQASAIAGAGILASKALTSCNTNHNSVNQNGFPEFELDEITVAEIQEKIKEALKAIDVMDIEKG